MCLLIGQRDARLVPCPVLQTPPLRGAAIFLGIPGHHQIITVAIDCDLRTLLRGIYLRLGAGGRNGHGPRTLR